MRRTFRKLGVLLSAYWIFGSVVGIATLQVQEGRMQANSFLALCLPTRHDRDWCEAEYASSLATLTAPHWSAILIVAAAPIAVVTPRCTGDTPRAPEGGSGTSNS